METYRYNKSVRKSVVLVNTSVVVILKKVCVFSLMARKLHHTSRYKTRIFV